MQLDAIRCCQVEFAALWVATEIGDDDPEAQKAFDDAFDNLGSTRPASMEEAAGRLRFLAQIGREFIGCTGTQQRIHAAMLMVAAWLALEATKDNSQHRAGMPEAA